MIGSIKLDEQGLMKVLLTMRHRQPRYTPADVGEIHHKRLDAILYKWVKKGWWDYGTSVRSGWFTEKGITAISNLVTTFSQGESS